MLIAMTTPLPLVERKRRQARQRIIQAAEELFLARGFDEVSVGDIAERAEVGRTTFFRHFGDKQEVVFAKWQELLETIAAADRQKVPPPHEARRGRRTAPPGRPFPLRPGGRRPRGLRPPFPARRATPGAARPRRREDAADPPNKLSDLLIHRGSDEATARLRRTSRPRLLPDRQTHRQQPPHPGGRDPGRLQTGTHARDRCRWVTGNTLRAAAHVAGTSAPPS